MRMLEHQFESRFEIDVLIGQQELELLSATIDIINLRKSIISMALQPSLASSPGHSQFFNVIRRIRKNGFFCV